MKTIKIIDLLNKIANGEEVPKRIRIREVEYKFTEIIVRNLTYSDRGSNINYAYENEFDNYWLDCARINEEVEIIEDAEEDEGIKKVDTNIPCSYEIETTLRDKLNEVIDIVNELKKEGK
jgi:hypothetical protein